MLAAALAAVAVLTPLAPAAAIGASATSVRSRVAETISPRSVMPAGGAIVASVLTPNAPTSTDPSRVEVTEGAAIEAVEPVPALNGPIGSEARTPEYARIAPEAARFSP
jgi:hypothetical protein